MSGWCVRVEIRILWQERNSVLCFFFKYYAYYTKWRCFETYQIFCVASDLYIIFEADFSSWRWEVISSVEERNSIWEEDSFADSIHDREYIFVFKILTPPRQKTGINNRFWMINGKYSKQMSLVFIDLWLYLIRRSRLPE